MNFKHPSLLFWIVLKAVVASTLNFGGILDFRTLSPFLFFRHLSDNYMGNYQRIIINHALLVNGQDAPGVRTVVLPSIGLTSNHVNWCGIKQGAPRLGKGLKEVGCLAGLLPRSRGRTLPPHYSLPGLDTGWSPELPLSPKQSGRVFDLFVPRGLFSIAFDHHKPFASQRLN